MTSLADDLLKTRSILDLNSVVDNLSNEILNKQKELQGMVGSQYNQFIRSADKIIDMKNRSNELLSSLTDFVSFNSKVITNFDKLVDQSFRSSGNVSAPTLQDQGITLSLMWQKMNCGEIYVVGKFVTTAMMFGFVGGSSVESNAELAAPGSGASSDRAFLKSVSFLSQDLLETCEMAIGNDDIQFNRLETIGKAILVYSVISGNLQKLARGYLEDVDSYINIADVRIQQIFDKPFHQSVSPTDAASTILSLIRFLQDIIVDLYYLFLKKFPDDSGSASVGLLSLYQAELTDDLESLLYVLTGRENSLKERVPNWLKWSHSRRAGEDRIKTWLSQKLKQVTEYSSKLLSRIEDAHQVAKLQQLVRASCIGDSRSEQFLLDRKAMVVRFSDAWKESISHIFSQVLRRSKIRVDASEYLWSSVFQVSFLQQVKRLLQTNSEIIVDQIRMKVIACMNKLGLNFNPDASGFTSRESKELNLSSSIIYHMARSIQRSLNQDLVGLMNDIISPIEDVSSHHVETLIGKRDSRRWELVQVVAETFCGLFSNLLNILRMYLSKIVEELKISMEIVYTSCESNYVEVEFLQSFFASFRSQSGGKAKLFEPKSPSLKRMGGLKVGALFLGRLALLLKQENEILHSDLFEIYALHEKLAEATEFGFITNEQLKSAFEIADTDGDGIINHSEAVEALSALSVSGINLTYQPRSFDYEEFLLIFGPHLLSPQEFDPSQLINNSLDRLILKSHFLWVTVLVETEFSYFEIELNSSLTNFRSSFSEAGFKAKALWALQTGEILQVGDPSLSGDGILLPSSCSVSLLCLLHKLSYELSAAGISIDLFQSELKVGEDEGFPEYSKQNNCLLPVLVHYFRETVFVSLHKIYGKILHLFSNLDGNDGTVEDNLLQCMYDLLILSQSLPKTGKMSSDFSLLLEKYEALMDPVNSEFALPRLRKEAELAVFTLLSLTHFRPLTLRKAPEQPNSTSHSAPTVEITLRNLLASSASSTNSSAPKFAFLPLALTTPSTMISQEPSKWNLKPRQEAASPTPDVSVEKSKKANGIRWW